MTRPVTRKPTVRKVSILEAQLEQLAIADPTCVRALAILVNDVFSHHLAAGTVVPITLRAYQKGGR